MFYKPTHAFPITLPIILVLWLVSQCNTMAQLESSKWIFGFGAGIDFCSGAPVAFSGSKINTTEGCSTVSDKNGNLLFYTDGITAWNRNNEVMANGNNLHGHVSSTQSVVIVPQPGSKTLFYIFTLDSEADDNGFSYSVADITKVGGLGEIVLKNQLIKIRCTERVAAIKHQNNKDIWIVIHEYDSDAFLSYLLTADGFNATPLISRIGIKHEKSRYNTIGYLKVSMDRKRLAIAVTGEKVVQLFDFNLQDGSVTNPKTIRFNNTLSPYGVEFSPNDAFLYVSIENKGTLYQCNLTNFTEEAIQKSLYTVGQDKCNFGALQLGMDGKIYVAEYKSKSLSVIDKPNLPGAACEYKPKAISLLNNTCTFGLPTFYQEYVKVHPINRKNLQFSSKPVLELDQTYILDKVYFDFNKAEFKKNAVRELKLLAKYLKKNPKLSIEITGHTDSIGSLQYNNALSRNRANCIGTFLINKGIEAVRVNCYGKGHREPVTSNSTEEGRQRNRRAELILSKLP